MQKWAIGKVNYNIKKGNIKRPDVCEACGRKARVVGHHEDYTYPLEVTWLCRSCHTIYHNHHNPKKRVYKSWKSEFRERSSK